MAIIASDWSITKTVIKIAGAEESGPNGCSVTDGLRSCLYFAKWTDSVQPSHKAVQITVPVQSSRRLGFLKFWLYSKLRFSSSRLFAPKMFQSVLLNMNLSLNETEDKGIRIVFVHLLLKLLVAYKDQKFWTPSGASTFFGISQLYNWIKFRLNCKLWKSIALKLKREGV